LSSGRDFLAKKIIWTISIRWGKGSFYLVYYGVGGSTKCNGYGIYNATGWDWLQNFKKWRKILWGGHTQTVEQRSSTKTSSASL